jgi:hypothetical protein
MMTAQDWTRLFNARRDRDSNPGTDKSVNGFRDRPIQPLWHLSSILAQNKNSPATTGEFFL